MEEGLTEPFVLLTCRAYFLFQDLSLPRLFKAFSMLKKDLGPGFHGGCRPFIGLFSWRIG
jgi:hypothetical protein